MGSRIKTTRDVPLYKIFANPQLILALIIGIALIAYFAPFGLVNRTPKLDSEPEALTPPDPEPKLPPTPRARGF